MRISQTEISKKTDGFTLLELILVILLISLLLTFASVKWDILPKKEKETFMERLAIELSLLRESSVSDYEQKAIELDFTGNTISLGYIDLVKGYVAYRELVSPEGNVLKNAIINGEKYSIGKVVMRAYPTGLIDRAILHFEGEEEGFYSIIINPLTAKITEERGHIEEIVIPKGDNPS